MAKNRTASEGLYLYVKIDNGIWCGDCLKRKEELESESKEFTLRISERLDGLDPEWDHVDCEALVKYHENGRTFPVEVNYAKERPDD